MPRVKNASNKEVQSINGKRDIMTEMFEHFGIEVVTVKGQVIKPKKLKRVKKYE